MDKNTPKIRQIAVDCEKVKQLNNSYLSMISS